MKTLIKNIVFKYLKEPEKVEFKSSNEKYKKSGLTHERAFEIRQRIQVAFEQDKIYRDNEIGLLELANHINQDRYKVSEVINKYYSQNFYSLLNRYRIEEAKELLLNNPFLSVKAIMYEVGFNSKNSFYNAFKRDTGLSPNDFRSIGTFQTQTAI